MPPLLEDDLGLLQEDQDQNRSLFSRASLLFGSGFNEGLANVVGLPVDAINAGLRRIGVQTSDVPIGGSQSIKKLFGSVGVATAKDIVPESLLERIVQRTGEEIGANVIPSATALRLARSPTTSRIANAILDPFRRAPASTTAIETTIAGGGGVGAGIAQEISPESPGAEITGQVVGGLTASLPFAAGSSALRQAQRTIAPFSKSGVEKRAISALGETTSKSLPELEARISQGLQRVREGIDVTPTTAQASEEPGLLTLERAFSRRSPAVREQLEGKIIGGKRAVRQSLEALGPAGDPETVAVGLDRKIVRITSTLDEQLRNAQTKLQAQVSQVRDISSEDLNRQVKAFLLDAEETAAQEAKRLFEEIDPGLPVRTARLKSTVKDMRQSFRKAEKPENIPSAVEPIEEFKKAESMAEIMALRSRITDDIRQEARQLAPNRRSIARLEQLKEQVDQTILNDVDAADDVATLYERARGFFRENVVDKFRQGTVARVLQTGRLGEASAIPESATISQFFRTGRGAVEAAKDFNRVLKSNEIARQSVSDAAVQDFASFSLNPDGTLNPNRARRWIANRKAALDEFPDVAERVNGMMTEIESVNRLTANVAKTKQRLDRSAARFFLNAEPESAVRRVMASPRRVADMRELVLLTRSDPPALNGLRASVWKEGLRQAEVGTFDEDIAAFFLSPKKLRNFFTQNRKMFLQSGLYDEKALNQVDKIVRASEIINASVVPGVTTVGSDTAANLQAIQSVTGLTLPGLLSRFYAIARGVVSPRFIFSEILLRSRQNIVRRLTEGQVNALLEEALIKPEVALDLLQKPSITTAIPKTARLRGHLINLGPILLDRNASQEVLAVEQVPTKEKKEAIKNILKSPNIPIEEKINAALQSQKDPTARGIRLAPR